MVFSESCSVALNLSRHNIASLFGSHTVLNHCRNSIHFLQYSISDLGVGIIHRKIVYIVRIRICAAHYKSTFRTAGSNLFLYLFNCSVGNLYFVFRKCFIKILLYKCRKLAVLCINKHNGDICGICFAVFRFEKRCDIGNKHRNSDCDYKKQRYADKNLVFQISFKFKFKYCSKLFHHLSLLTPARPHTLQKYRSKMARTPSPHQYRSSRQGVSSPLFYNQDLQAESATSHCL